MPEAVTAPLHYVTDVYAVLSTPPLTLFLSVQTLKCGWCALSHENSFLLGQSVARVEVLSLVCSAGLITPKLHAFRLLYRLRFWIEEQLRCQSHGLLFMPVILMHSVL